MNPTSNPPQLILIRPAQIRFGCTQMKRMTDILHFRGAGIPCFCTKPSVGFVCIDLVYQRFKPTRSKNHRIKTYRAGNRNGTDADDHEHEQHDRALNSDPTTGAHVDRPHFISFAMQDSAASSNSLKTRLAYSTAALMSCWLSSCSDKACCSLGQLTCGLPSKV